MEAKRWTLGIVLAAAVSLFGLIQADASPFSSYVLSDDLGNMVRGTAAEASDWDTEADTADESGGADSSGDASGDGSGDGGGDDWTVNNVPDDDGKSNNGHGNNEDGVDSSNKGNSKTGEDTVCAEDGTVCDDEIKTSGGKKK